ncbi:MAG: HupE/UreJ family protein [Gammaproteobacteria bacterium]|nr:HupE/UreJ family protein [Gammaproteobacteria bacterium]
MERPGAIRIRRPPRPGGPSGRWGDADAHGNPADRAARVGVGPASRGDGRAAREAAFEVRRPGRRSGRRALRFGCGGSGRRRSPVIRRLAWLLGSCLAVSAGPAQAHEVRPGYLQVQETAAGQYDVLWKVPANGEYRLSLYVRLPADCTGKPTQGTFAGGAFVERWRAKCPGGLVGRTIAIDGLSATRTDVLARIERLDGTTQTVRLTPGQPSFEVTAVPDRLQVTKTYFVLGVEHILLGIDHLLFVLGLLFLVGSWRRLVATVTAFTVAHSITLAAATLGWVHVAQAPVEATIALSVMFVAAEILRGAQGHAGLAARAPWIVAFVFGLLHGFGFAGALRQVGLPEKDIPLALLFFNVGVEVGQLMFIAAVVAVLSTVTRLFRRQGGHERGPWYSEALIRTPVAYVIGSVAAFWVVQRVGAFWP